MKRRVYGAALILLGILLAVGLVSYTEPTSNPKVENLSGKFGDWTSLYMFYLFGYAKWIWPLFAFLAGWHLIKGPQMPEKKPSTLAGSCLLLLIFVCGMIHLVAPVQQGVGAGGTFGMWAVERLGIFGGFGTLLILLFCGALGVVGLLPASTLARILDWAAIIPLRLRDQIVARLQAWKTKWKSDRDIPVTSTSTPVVQNPKPVPVVTTPSPDEPVPDESDESEDEPESPADSSAAALPAMSKTVAFPGSKESVRAQTPEKKPVPLPPDEPDETPAETEFRKGLARYRLPPLELLKWPVEQVGGVDQKALQATGKILEDTLKNFGIDAQVVQIIPGPTVTLYEVMPAAGVPVARIAAREADIKLSLAANSIRILAPIPGKSVVGVEAPNPTPQVVKIRELLAFEKFSPGAYTLPFALGKDILGKPVMADLQKMPHVLIAGATGSGKSVCVAGLLITLLYRLNPEQLRLILIDPKRVELAMFSDLPHLLSPPILDAKTSTEAFQWLLGEMERRYTLLSESGSKNLEGYNTERVKNGKTIMPYIVLVVDELADLMLSAPRETESAITRLAQMARAVGIHLVLATQRPSVDVITGLIKANMPARIAFQVASQFDSRTILDTKGAEALLGRGDMLYLSPSASNSIRLQGAYVDEEEIRRVVDFLRNQLTPVYVDLEEYTDNPDGAGGATFGGGDGEDIDPQLYEAAKQFTIKIRKGSISRLQKTFQIGFNKAVQIMDMMEKDGIVGPNKGPTPRDVLVGKPRMEEDDNRG